LQTKTNGFMAIGRKRAPVWLQHDKGVHRHAVARGENLRVVHAKISPVQLSAHRSKQIGSVRAPDENFRPAACGLWTQQDHRLRQIVVEKMAGMPGELMWAVTHKIVRPTARPDL